MARGISLHVGVNRADPSFEVAKLVGCVKDAEAMFDIATSRGFEPRKILRNKEATFANVRDAVLDAAETLVSGDIFLFTFSGHGSSHPRIPQPGDEEGIQDETILLRDCILIDNYLRRNLWSQFKKGVRILGVADSCHSGTVLTFIAPVLPSLHAEGSIEAVAAAAASAAPESRTPSRTDTKVRAGSALREFNAEDQRRILERSPAIHEKLRNELLSGEQAKLKATLITLAACMDHQKARDGDPNGAFTEQLLNALAQNPEPENYDDLMARIKSGLEPLNLPQTPVRFPVNADADFLAQRPFSIDSA